MVLKVVTGKIFKTLELWMFAHCPAVRFWNNSWAPGEKALAFGMRALALVPGRCGYVKSSKNADYLVDNIVVIILS
jgi:hypothetical protein